MRLTLKLKMLSLTWAFMAIVMTSNAQASRGTLITCHGFNTEGKDVTYIIEHRAKSMRAYYIRSQTPNFRIHLEVDESSVGESTYQYELSARYLAQRQDVILEDDEERSKEPFDILFRATLKLEIQTPESSMVWQQDQIRDCGGIWPFKSCHIIETKKVMDTPAVCKFSELRD